MTRVVRSEFRKIVTTNTWWLFLLAVLGFTALGFAFNAFQAHTFLHHPIPRLTADTPAEQARQMRTAWVAQSRLVVQAANLYTSGQYFGLLFVMLLGILVVTNEFQHQTATATFLATPRRTAVVAGKLTATALSAAGLCLGTMALCVIAGVIFFRVEGAGLALGEPAVVRALLLNLLAYAIWAIFGVGFGTLIRSQVAAVVVGLALYLIASQVAAGVFQAISFATHAEWVAKMAVVVPSIASQAMIAGGDLPGNPPQWLAAVVLSSYGIAAGAIGLVLTARRDIA